MFHFPLHATPQPSTTELCCRASGNNGNNVPGARWFSSRPLVLPSRGSDAFCACASDEAFEFIELNDTRTTRSVNGPIMRFLGCVFPCISLAYSFDRRVPPFWVPEMFGEPTQNNDEISDSGNHTSVRHGKHSAPYCGNHLPAQRGFPASFFEGLGLNLITAATCELKSVCL